MAKANSNRRLVWYAIGGIALGVVAWSMTSGSDAPVSTKRPTTVAHLTSSTSPAADQYTDADYNAKFQHVVIVTPKDVFKPVVYRAGAGPGGKSSNAANAIPAPDADGDGNWTFNGTASDGSKLQALFQNSTSGDGVFLNRGEHWKSLVVEQIDQDSCVINGPAGKKKLTPVLEEPTKPAAVATNETAQTVAPVTPPLSGAIGADAAGQTENSGAGTDMMQGFGGGRGGRRFRGGGFGGGNYRGNRGGGNFGGGMPGGGG